MHDLRHLRVNRAIDVRIYHVNAIGIASFRQQLARQIGIVNLPRLLNPIPGIQREGEVGIIADTFAEVLNQGIWLQRGLNRQPQPHIIKVPLSEQWSFLASAETQPRV